MSRWNAAKTFQWYIFKRRDDVSRVRYNDAPSVRLHDVSNKCQIKHVSGTSPRRFSGMYPQLSITTSLRNETIAPNETNNNFAVVRFHQVLELVCRDSLLVGLCYFAITSIWEVSTFHLSIKSKTKFLWYHPR